MIVMYCILSMNHFLMSFSCFGMFLICMIESKCETSMPLTVEVQCVQNIGTQSICLSEFLNLLLLICLNKQLIHKVENCILYRQFIQQHHMIFNITRLVIFYQQLDNQVHNSSNNTCPTIFFQQPASCHHHHQFTICKVVDVDMCPRADSPTFGCSNKWPWAAQFCWAVRYWSMHRLMARSLRVVPHVVRAHMKETT